MHSSMSELMINHPAREKVDTYGTHEAFWMPLPMQGGHIVADNRISASSALWRKHPEVILSEENNQQ